jgi:hypothetical protein
MSPDELNKLIDRAIDELASDNIRFGAESLQELAYIWSKAGIPINSFLDARKYIISEASNRTDALFIQEKLKIAEQQKRASRNGTAIYLN